jgi:hypothetical protein
MNPDQANSVIGIYLTIISISLIYEVLHLQIWVESVDKLYDDVSGDENSYIGKGNPKRAELTKKCKRIIGQHPSLLSYLLLVFAASLSTLGVFLSYAVNYVEGLLYTGVPIVLFLAIVIISDMSFTHSRRSKIREIQSKIEKWGKA